MLNWRPHRAWHRYWHVAGMPHVKVAYRSMKRVRLETEQLKILVSGSGGKTLMSESWVLAGSKWADQVSILEKLSKNLVI